MSIKFELQGHRGARGLKPENTLPSFEAAFDLGVTAVETDVHLTRDSVAVLIHDAILSDSIYRPSPVAKQPAPALPVAVPTLTLEQLRCLRADGNPNPGRFPHQEARVTPLTHLYSVALDLDPFAPPTLADLFSFTTAYGGEMGMLAGKTDQQRARVRNVAFDLELKRIPFRPEAIGDHFDGVSAAHLEQRLLGCIHAAGVLERTTVRSFDHRCIRALKLLEPRLTGAVLVAGTAPVDPVQLVQQAEAAIYCPQFEFLDQLQLRQLHAAKIRVIPWTVNDPRDWQRLLDWGVDGITTDFPDRLAAYLRERDLPF